MYLSRSSNMKKHWKNFAKRKQFSNVFRVKIIKQLSDLPKILMILQKRTSWKQLRSFEERNFQQKLIRLAIINSSYSISK
mmetsp:Transcript_17985/g.25626  ORF Transcript_17985/g.25626 Transcript_17985/m.25626 type:complete len:80 (+) Transcript_17985:754-993(+)